MVSQSADPSRPAQSPRKRLPTSQPTSAPEAKSKKSAPPVKKRKPPRKKKASEVAIDLTTQTGKVGIAALLAMAPSWLISMVIHGVAVPVLAVITISSISDREQFVIASGPVEVADDLDEVEFELEIPKELDLSDEASFDTPTIDPGAIDFGDLAAPVEVMETNVSELMLAKSSVAEIGALFGTDGKGMASFGDGMKGAAMFFGTKSKGNRFCFLVDNSNSMGGGKLETALLELGQAVNTLQPKQKFYIIFYSDTAYPLFHPEKIPDMVPATDKNKSRVAQWLPRIEMCLRTDGKDALQMALELRPDVIYILGDGAFTDKTADLLVANPIEDVVIHTLGMNVKPNVVADFSGIAMKHKGTYKDVGVSSEGKAMSKAKPVPKNNSRKSIWGLKLPVKK